MRALCGRLVFRRWGFIVLGLRSGHLLVDNRCDRMQLMSRGDLYRGLRDVLPELLPRDLFRKRFHCTVHALRSWSRVGVGRDDVLMPGRYLLGGLSHLCELPRRVVVIARLVGVHKLRWRLLRFIIRLVIVHLMRSWQVLELDRGDGIKLLCAMPRGHRVVILVVIPFVHELLDRLLRCGWIIKLWRLPRGLLLGILGLGELHELRGGLLRARHH